MNYRHLYHAGNPCDVFKHYILTLLLAKLTEKPTPFCVLDTHAGIGHYDLHAPEAQKTREAGTGILKLLHASNLPPALAAYTAFVKAYSLGYGGPEDRYYPGSPALAAHYLRPTDQLIACELHPEDAATLTHSFRQRLQIHIHQRDGYEALKALLPPTQKRGLILTDPPFENRDEFDTMQQALIIALQRFRQGIYALWYPIKSRAQAEQLFLSLPADCPEALRAEILFYPDLQPDRLNGCGLLILNPPWKLQETLTAELPALLHALEMPHGSFRLQLRTVNV